MLVTLTEQSSVYISDKPQWVSGYVSHRNERVNEYEAHCKENEELIGDPQV